MTSSLSSSQSFVQRTFPPLIGALTSPSVEVICQANNVSFVELIHPFCNIYVDYHLKDPSGNDHLIKHLKVGVKDVKEVPLDAKIARRMLDEAVAGAWCDVTRDLRTPKLPGCESVDIPAECPWFKAWTETFLQVQVASDHEFTKHLLGCMLVMSTTDPPEKMQELLETFKKMQNSKFPKWFCPIIFKFYVLVHDARTGDKSVASQFFESLKVAYGDDHCFFLEINSRKPEEVPVLNLWNEIKNTPVQLQEVGGNDLLTQAFSLKDPLSDHPLSPNIDNHISIVNSTPPTKSIEVGSYLSSRDLDSLREMLVYLARRSLLPHVEKQIYLLNDSVANKKGMSRSLFTATKRLFGSPRPGGNAAANNAVLFPPDASDLQLRRLADLYFLFGSYSNAYQSYYTAKRELGAAQAWLYYAGALEMAALSAFMQSEMSKKALEYMEEAIETYFSACQMPMFATRATLLSAACLKERAMYTEAAKQLMRMTSEESDLRSALLLEQAAYCLLRDAKPRKYAFQLVLAGHRFKKAGQKRHALRCVRQALQVYGTRGWCLAEDHLNFSIGRLAGQLHQSGGVGTDQHLLGEGLRAFAQLLQSRSKQSMTLQATYLFDYLNMHQAWVNAGGSTKLMTLPLPTIDDNSPSVRVVAATRDLPRFDAFESETPEQVSRWARMEEMGLAETIGAPMVFRPTLPVLSKRSLNQHGPTMAVKERLEVQMALHNPLQISLKVTRLRLLWVWNDGDGREVDGNGDASNIAEENLVAITDEMPHLLIPPQANYFVTLGVVPLQPGNIHIRGIAFSLTTKVITNQDVADYAVADQAEPMVRGRQDLLVRGPKLKPPKDRPFSDFYADDKRLQATVTLASPMLVISGVPPSMEMICGQMEYVELEFLNVGSAPVTSLHIVIDAKGMVALPQENISAIKTVYDNDHKLELQVLTLNLNFCGGMLQPGNKLCPRIWIRAPDNRGLTQYNLLFIYTGIDGKKHRVVRSTIRLSIMDGIQLSAVASRSAKGFSEIANICSFVSNNHLEAATIKSLVLASRHWRLKPSAFCPEDMLVQPTETSLLMAQALGSVDNSGVRNMSDSSEVIVTMATLQGDDVSLDSAAQNYLCNRASTKLMAVAVYWETTLEKRLLKGLTSVDLAGLNITVGSMPPANLPIADMRHAPQSLTIFGPNRMDTSPATIGSVDASLISITLSHKDDVQHCFTKDRICMVDVTVAILNSSRQQIAIQLNSAEAEQPALPRNQVYMPLAAGAFTWAGRKTLNTDVPPLGKTSVQLKAVFTRPGTYDLAVRLSAAISDPKGVRYLPPPPESPLVVSDLLAS